MSFKDYFSEVSSGYQSYRPDYPEALFRYLSSLCQEHQLAWDCATGNGQAAKSLSPYFDRVIASDGSQAQIDSAILDPKIQYRCEPAEHTTLKSHSVDLITVAQAAHWFDLPKFYAEARRVLKPEGILALWCYQIPEPENSNVRDLLDQLYWKITRSYWAKERDYIDHGYADLYFPFQRLSIPTFFIQKLWSSDQFLGYLGTWSGLRAFLKADPADAKPLEEIFSRIKNAWPKATDQMEIRWPMIVLATKDLARFNVELVEAK